MKTKIRSNSKKNISTNRINNNNKQKITKQINRTLSSSNTIRNKRIKSKQKIIIEEEKNLKASQEEIKEYKSGINYSMNFLGEKKINNSINRLIDTSQNLLEKQNDILRQANNLMQNIETNNHEIDKIKKKEGKQNFIKNINIYNKNLEDVLTKLKLNTKELGFSNKMKEENNKLKYKMEMLSIDKNDDFRNMESDLNSLKHIYITEMNSMLRYLYELGLDDISLSQRNINSENLTSEVIINFFNSIKNIIKQLTQSNKEKEGQIELLKKNNIENRNEINYNNKKNYKYYDFNNMINNDRIKKIEELCLKHTYDIDNIKENKIISQSDFDNFKRSKNTISDLGIQLEHNYTDSYFYPNVKESLENDNNNHNDYLEEKNNIKEYISRINESQPMNKFI